ncbi:MAG TPA: hypothetical protein VG502_10615 [Flexivirga sp.]|uniref:hypothetical protein n=1 Tax=Flexivirga sp. TaxID=1962927 RepID=UPI002C593416|nr:hypothetical protein [Flexivirga sp.]HWC22739.1 hypothetical protein [Flexivirga sp.]
MDADTVWNDVPDEPSALELALRARVAWLAHHLDDLELAHDIVQSSGGGTWVLRLWAPTAIRNLRVQVEIQEGMTAYEWRPDTDRPYRDRVKGPAPVIALRMSDVDTSEGFDWKLLLRLFDEHGQPRPDWPWQQTSANPRHTIDRANWKAMIAAGGPKSGLAKVSGWPWRPRPIASASSVPGCNCQRH